MASLRHPNVVAVLDLDEASRRIVMELAAGGTLRDVQRERGPRTLRRAIERHGQILSALAAAHRRGIVHCDLKPANLMFRRNAELPGVEVMLGDFGVAHLPDATGQVAAGARAEAVGTLAYMAPEQRRGEVSPAADVYASAVVLFEMFTGRTPWTREAVMAGRAARRGLPAAARRADQRTGAGRRDPAPHHAARRSGSGAAADHRAGARRVAAAARADHRRRLCVIAGVRSHAAAVAGAGAGAGIWSRPGCRCRRSCRCCRRR